MADAVQSGVIVNPEPDPNQILEDEEHEPLAEGGGEVEDLDQVRAETGTGNDDPEPQELHTADDLNDDAKED